MSKFFKSNKQSKEAKRRFEHLMVIAKENPDKIFDLSSCELTAVPQSLFVQCRVLLSESLLLYSNKLKSLKGGGKMTDLSSLRVLDLHDNVITLLPEDIGSLKSLQVLNVQNNKLIELPSSIGKLKRLQTLLLRDNALTCIPETVREMSSLRTLDISGENKVYYLPKALCYVRTLEALILPKPHCMEYPPPMVATEGLEAIQKYLCKDCGIEYVAPSHNVTKVLSETQVDGQSSSRQFIEEQRHQMKTGLDLYEQQKQEKKKQLLEIERQIAESQREQALLSFKTKQAKSQEQVDLKKDYENFDKTIREQQAKKDKERSEMLMELKLVEQQASGLVAQMLGAAERARHQEDLLEKMERQRIEQEEYFKVTQEDLDRLRKQDTLAAMESILIENDQYNSFIQKYLAEQDYARRKAQLSMGEDDRKIVSELERQHSNQTELIQRILTEEHLQKEAFAALQFQQDAVHCRLMNDIGQLESELIKLTQVEAQKKKMKVGIEQESLTLIRSELTDLLVQLLKEKDNREEMLRDRLVEMEQQKEDDQVDFWLVQYQRLLDSKPEVLIQKEHGLEEEVVSLLRRAGASHHIPAFARHRVTSSNMCALDDKQLQSIGVFEIGIRQNILKEIESFVALSKIAMPDETIRETVPKATPISPPGPSIVTPSAPLPSESEENECVVCLDRTSDCVFLPCGHVCSCFECSSSLTKCPMCRIHIVQKVRIFRS